MIYLSILLGEIISCRIALRIMGNITPNVYIKQADRGFKINREKAIEAVDKDYEKRKKKISKGGFIFRALGLFLLLVLPGVNILTALIRSHMDQKRTVKILEENDCLIPLCALEKLDYSYAETKAEKYQAARKYCPVNKEKEQEQEAVVGQISEEIMKQAAAKMPVPGFVTPISGERLVAISYTLDEIKELANVINESYCLGKVDDINTALIGVPKSHGEVKRVMFTSDGEKQICYDFIPYTEEQAKNERFIVYPYKKEYEKELDKAVYGLIAKRNKAELEYHGTINGQKMDYSSFMETSGPSLRRIMK